jgi:hypothetical protein
MRLLRIALPFAVAAGCAGPAPAPSWPPPAGVVDDWGGPAALVPFQHWLPVPGRVVGLLFARGAQPWGGSLSYGRGSDTGTERTEYAFSFDRSSPYALYFASDGRGFNFLSDWGVPLPDGSTARYDAAMFGPETPDPWGLDRPAHLVELEVNDGRGGRGGPTGLHFVVTGARVIDGSDECPVPAEQLLVDLRRRFDETARRHEADLGGWLADASPVRRVAVWPTWMRDDETIEALFVLDVAAAPDGPTPSSGYTMAAFYVADCRGNVERETVYAPLPRGTAPVAGEIERAEPGRHLTVESAVTGTACQGVAPPPGGPPRFHTVFVRVDTEAEVRLEAMRVGAECRGLALGTNRGHRADPSPSQGERLQIGDDPVSDYTYRGEATCPSAPPPEADQAELYYWVDDRLHVLPFRFERPRAGPCLAPSAAGPPSMPPSAPPPAPAP